jgi:hypothetical protein
MVAAEKRRRNCGTHRRASGCRLRSDLRKPDVVPEALEATRTRAVRGVASSRCLCGGVAADWQALRQSAARTVSSRAWPRSADSAGQAGTP